MIVLAPSNAGSRPRLVGGGGNSGRGGSRPTSPIADRRSRFRSPDVQGKKPVGRRGPQFTSDPFDQSKCMTPMAREVEPHNLAMTALNANVPTCLSRSLKSVPPPHNKHLVFMGKAATNHRQSPPGHDETRVHSPCLRPDPSLGRSNRKYKCHAEGAHQESDGSRERKRSHRGARSCGKRNADYHNQSGVQPFE